MPMQLSQLIVLLKRGIIISRNFDDIKPFPGAILDGKYNGCPGRDIHAFLQDCNDDQAQCLALAIAEYMPTIRQRSPNITSMLREIYGMTQKNGCLLSDARKKELICQKPDFSNIHKFFETLIDVLEKQNKHYGIALCSEMMAHRFGDELVIQGADPLKLQKMIGLYARSISICEQYKFFKNILTARYWCARYLIELGYCDEGYRYGLEFTKLCAPGVPRTYHKKILNWIEALSVRCPKRLQDYAIEILSLGGVFESLNYAQRGLKNPFLAGSF